MEQAPKQAANQHPMSVEARGGLLVAHSPAEDTSAGLLQCMHHENMLVGPVLRQEGPTSVSKRLRPWEQDACHRADLLIRHWGFN